MYGGSQAFYRPSTDEVHLPEREKFKSTQSFYDSESYRKLQKEKDEWLKSLHLDENKILDIGSDYL